MYEIAVTVTQEQYSYDLPDGISTGMIETTIRLPPMDSLTEARQYATEIIGHNHDLVPGGEVTVSKDHVIIASEEQEDMIEISITEV